MKRLGTIFIVWMLICAPLAAQGEATLQSVQRGQAGDRTWLVFTFDQQVIWNGLSRAEEGKLSLYIMGSPGSLNGKSWEMGDIFGPSVTVRRIDQQPGVFGVDCLFPSNVPVAVVKRLRHLIISFRDDRFVQQAFGQNSGDISATPGMLTGFESAHENSQAVHTLAFNGSFNWVAFMQPAGSVGALFVDGAGIGITQRERVVSESDLSKMQLFPVPDRRALKAVLYFEPGAAYSVVKKHRQLIVQTTSRPIGKDFARSEPPQKKEDMDLLDALLMGEEESQPGKAEAVPEPISRTLSQTPEKRVDKAESTMPAPVKKEDVGPVAEIAREEKVEQTEESDWQRLKAFRSNVESGAKAKAPTKLAKAPSLQRLKARDDKPEEQPEWDIPWSQSVSFRFDDTPLKDALRTVSRVNRINMVIGSGVTGKVTMDLQKVTLRQALNMLVYTNDCEYVVDEGIITVKTTKKEYAGGMITRVYRLKNAEADNLAPVIKQIVSDDSLVQVYYPEFLNFDKAGKQRQAANKVAIQGVRRSSVLVVTGRPEHIREVDRVIEELDRPIKQIMIHSKLVEMSPQNNSQMGINWDKTITMALNQVDILNGGEKMNYSALNDAPGNGGSMNLGHLSASKFKAVIDFLDETTETKLKSNPSLLAMDNHETSISVGTTVPVPKIQRGFGGQQDMVTFDYKEVNIQLNVTPHITENERITMFVNPVIEEISGWVEYEGNQAPITNKRAVNSIVNVQNGETVVIGGLIKTQKMRTVKKVWLLGSLPLLGKLFQHETFEDKQTDLMIFITPQIVENNR